MAAVPLPCSGSGRSTTCKLIGSSRSQFSIDPEFAPKVRDIVVGLYIKPPHRAIIPGVDERSQIQALDRQ